MDLPDAFPCTAQGKEPESGGISEWRCLPGGRGGARQVVAAKKMSRAVSHRSSTALQDLWPTREQQRQQFLPVCWPRYRTRHHFNNEHGTYVPASSYASVGVNRTSLIVQQTISSIQISR